ncbi:MAG: hypothetical protein ACR2PL_26175 [Dehalococcoidia bacterium]
MISLLRPGEPAAGGDPLQPALEITDELAEAPENGPELGGEGVALSPTFFGLPSIRTDP